MFNGAFNEFLAMFCKKNFCINGIDVADVQAVAPSCWKQIYSIVSNRAVNLHA